MGIWACCFFTCMYFFTWHVFSKYEWCDAPSHRQRLDEGCQTWGIPGSITLHGLIELQLGQDAFDLLDLGPRGRLVFGRFGLMAGRTENASTVVICVFTLGWFRTRLTFNNDGLSWDACFASMAKRMKNGRCTVSREVAPWQGKSAMIEASHMDLHDIPCLCGIDMREQTFILRSTVCQGAPSAHVSLAKHLADSLLWQHISVSYRRDHEVWSLGAAMKCRTKWPIGLLHHRNLPPVGSHWNTGRVCEVILGFHSMSSQALPKLPSLL